MVRFHRFIIVWSIRQVGDRVVLLLNRRDPEGNHNIGLVTEIHNNPFVAMISVDYTDEHGTKHHRKVLETLLRVVP